ncbi:MAG: hypothetical protein E5Y88_31960 [Mesorhizobium sp.]|uniref:hypothetical protein n=1 Tax=Mesorhizobium sp. TaxID=1871066 RepID=UPI00120A02ED|nr:hypothetical protein [Mesorhizobium sp.]TIL20964.1 MAG: hypothetical protein E5Y88_31960 [Mesorhizobium sp.]TIQ36370.1 MAG: hypothetical protein E5X49_32760 [Mesorhizobium sp.]TIW59483.1 MAG: hypothetical protein E5V48_17670 [Mesorhizobium sp.]TJW31290.1 MAG: hypothetical protein E5V49_17085 [Mesorhizobium sp.]
MDEKTFDDAARHTLRVAEKYLPPGKTPSVNDLDDAVYPFLVQYGMPRRHRKSRTARQQSTQLSFDLPGMTTSSKAGCRRVWKRALMNYVQQQKRGVRQEGTHPR